MPSVGSDPSKYVVIIDAGSSGSRSYIFEWTDPEYILRSRNSVSPSLPKIHHGPTWAKKITPGIASFVHDKDIIWSEYLRHLIDHAESIIPEEKWESTPIFFMATAGMRLLNSSDQADLLDQIFLILRDRTHFSVANRKTNVQIIDGEEEGLYGWLALNYLTGSLDGTLQSSSKVSYGFMDMGGASAQIAFAPNASEAVKHEDQLYRVNLRTLDGKLHNWEVFLATWLGFGANEARTRFAQYLVNQGRTEDPCLPKGLASDIPNSNQTQIMSLKGTSDFNGCLKSIQPLLNKHMPCKGDPCLFNGQRVPALDFKYNKFVGVSEYWYTSHDIFGMDGMYDYGVYQEKVKEFCDSSWDDIVENSNGKNYHGVSKESLQRACFKSTWIINMLHEGFGVPIEPIASTVENAPFTAPFQSVSHVNGIEMSWPLGRAVLYASGQIPARHNDPEVGYFTSLSSSNGATFVPGALPGYLAGGIFTHTVGRLNPIVSSWFYLTLIIVLLFYLVKSRRLLNSSVKRISNRAKTMASSLIKRSKVDTEDRLLEEGLAMKPPSLSRAFSMETVETTTQYPAGSSERRNLGTSTSMLDLKSGFMISRESSRMSLRQENQVSKE